MEPETRSGGAAIRTTTAHLCFLILALALPPRAALAEGSSTLILYDGVVSASEATTAAAALAERLKLGGSDKYRAEFLSDAVFGGAEHWPSSGEVRFCASSNDNVYLDQLLEEAHAMAAEERFAEAEAALGGALDNLACVAPPLDPAQLARAALLLGWMRVELEDRDGAKLAYQMATAFDPAVEWFPEYPSHAQQVFVFAARAALKSHDARFDPGTAEDDADEIRIDGVKLPERTRLRPGWHQVSVPTRDGGQLRLAVRFVAGGTVRLVNSGELLESFLIGDGGDAAGRAIASVMNRSGDDTAYLIEPALDRVFRFERASLEITELPVWDGAPWRPQASQE